MQQINLFCEMLLISKNNKELFIIITVIFMCAILDGMRQRNHAQRCENIVKQKVIPETST